MAGHRQLEPDQDHREQDQQQARDVERQAAEADEGEDDRQSAQDAGDEVRVLELEQEPVEADREQDEGDVRVGQQMEELLERVHPQRSRGRVGDRERLWLAVHGHGPTIGEREDVGERAGDPVDRADLERLGRRRRAGIADGLLGPVGVPTARLRDRSDAGDRIVEDLLAEVALDVLTLATHRRRRADVRARSHHGDVTGQRDERPRAGGTGARWRDPHDRRQWRLEQRRHDALGGVQAAARRVQLDHHSRCAVALRLGDALGEVAGHDVVDDAVRGQDHDARTAGRW